ncbi:MAG TPA: hypothetical protein VH143_10585, partial [Kofleriaceae bacterium]|nr:hypothetical protein [Kofleriaceae bacterium]
MPTPICSPGTGEYQASWRRFLTTFEPLRSELYRHCRYLTRGPVQYGPAAARRTVLNGMLFGARLMAGPDNPLDRELTRGVLADSPRVEARLYRGRWIVLGWYKHADGEEAVRAITTLELARLVNYFYTPEFLRDVGDELGVPSRSNGHH